jgi:hypothetical protein
MRRGLVGRNRDPVRDDKDTRHAFLEKAMCAGSEGSLRVTNWDKKRHAGEVRSDFAALPL